MAREELNEPSNLNNNVNTRENEEAKDSKSGLDSGRENSKGILNNGIFNNIPIEQLSNLNLGDGKATTSTLYQPQVNTNFGQDNSLPSTSNTGPSSSFSTLNKQTEQIEENLVNLPKFQTLEKPLDLDSKELLEENYTDLSRSNVASPILHQEKPLKNTKVNELYIPEVKPDENGSYRLDGKLDGQEVIDWLNTPQLPDQADLYQDVYHSYSHFDDEQDNLFNIKENNFIQQFISQSTSEDVVSFLSQTRYTDEVYGLPSYLKKFFDDLPPSDFNQPIQAHHITAINRLLQLKSHLKIKLGSDNPTVTKKELDKL
jgi:hypothetical protein